VDDKSEFQNTAAVREMARAVEKAGADACYITDHPAPSAAWRSKGGHDALDPFAALAFVAAATDKIRLHTNLVVLPYRNPFINAKAATTVDVLSNGRLIMGVGVGYQAVEYAALGVEFDQRGADTDEAIRVMKAAWSEKVVTLKGRTWDASEGVMISPKPVQKPNPPIWVGGNSERAIRRAAELCDGWSPFFASAGMSKAAGTDELSTLEQAKAKIGQLQDYRGKYNRTGPFDICLGPKGGLMACTSADADKFVADCAELAGLGVNWVMLGVGHATRAEWLRDVAWAGEALIPKVQAIKSKALS
jgi:probable F420-dependent oxidoreductase